MENNNVSLSQAEVDKLLGIISQSDDSNKKTVEKKQYKTRKVFTEDGINIIRKISEDLYDDFLAALKAKFGAPKIRKLLITSIDQICSEEFFDGVTSNDFIYKVTYKKASIFIKLDPFLFGALSGLTIDPKHKINFFQSDVLRHFVIAILTHCIEEKYKLKTAVEVENLFEKDTDKIKNEKTGLCITISWNENLRSLGIEKLFITPEFMKILK